MWIQTLFLLQLVVKVRVNSMSLSSVLISHIPLLLVKEGLAVFHLIMWYFPIYEF